MLHNLPDNYGQIPKPDNYSQIASKKTKVNLMPFHIR